MPVVDGVSSAVRHAETLVALSPGGARGQLRPAAREAECRAVARHAGAVGRAPIEAPRRAHRLSPAATGIGRAVALAGADEGADVAACWIDREPEARDLTSAIQERGRLGLAVRADVTQEADVVALVDRVERELGPLDVLVNNAGVQRPQGITEMSVADWDRMMNVHLRGAFLCSREAAKRMMPRRRGWIINLCSQLGYIGRERYTAYSAAKGGMIAFTRALAKELAPHGILVNGVAPGLVDTGFDPLPEE